MVPMNAIVVVGKDPSKYPVLYYERPGGTSTLGPAHRRRRRAAQSKAAF